MAFRGVCTSWRAVATKDKFVPSWPPIVPLLMLPGHENANHEREFYSISQRSTSLRLSLPEAKGKRCIGVRFGWVLTIANSGEITLLNPFSRECMILPRLKRFPKYKGYRTDPFCFFIKQAVLSHNPSNGSDFTLMTIAYGSRFLAFWRPGNPEWTRIPRSTRCTFRHVNYYKGKFYAITAQGAIMAWNDDDQSSLPKFAVGIFSIADESSWIHKQVYLVKSSSGELRVVLRVEDGHEDGSDDYLPIKYYYTTRFKVYHLDIVQHEWKEISSLGGDAVFIGSNAAISISMAEAELSGIQSNCIYFTDDFLEACEPEARMRGKDMGIYNVEDGNVERFHGIEGDSVTSLICPSFWISQGDKD
ncbi:OLC1v1024138C1 [Oldenlandia corymbosa var. corymbosa]|nr:OLC1v1024138C1 [Oldenlandia corymbosa var. corymbosa]